MPGTVIRLARRQRAIVTILLAAQFMMALDISVVSVAVPRIQEHLHIASANLQWTSTAYTLTFGGFLVLAGRASDMLGRRRMFLAGLTIFTVSSLLCGLAVRDWQLFAARALQGIGAAIVAPAALSTLITSFPEEELRRRVLAWWGVVASASAIVGQLIGGVLTDVWGWRSVFLINIPVGIVTLVAARMLLPREAPPDRWTLDTTGAVSVTLGGILLVFAFSQSAERGFGAISAVALVAAVVSLTVFILQERHHSEPMVRLGIFRNRSLVGGNVVSVLNAAATTTAIFFSTLYMQQVLGYSPIEAGFAFAPVTVAVLVVSSQTARLVTAFGVRALLAVGAILTGGGFAALLLMSPTGTYWGTLLPGLMLLGVGQGLAFAPAMMAATDGVPGGEQGLATGLVSASQQMGGAVGFALLAMVATLALPHGTVSPAALVHGYRVGYFFGLALPALTFVAAITLTPGRGAPEPAPGLARSDEASAASH